MKNRYNIQRPEGEWEGLTLDEIRYARALTETRILITREMLSARAHAIFNGNASGTGPRSFMGRMLSSLSWLDYGLILLRVGSKIRSIMRKNKR